jgi:hypothetical protein
MRAGENKENDEQRFLERSRQAMDADSFGAFDAVGNDNTEAERHQEMREPEGLAPRMLTAMRPNTIAVRRDSQSGVPSSMNRRTAR